MKYPTTTKGDVRSFMDSQEDGWWWKIKDESKKNSLSELGEILDTYFLFGRPNSYTIVEWEYESCFKMRSKNTITSRNDGKLRDLESDFLSFKRNKLIEQII